VAALMDILLPKVPAAFIAVHFHDTYGRGITNMLESVEYGIRVVDASAGGLGGCPFAPGATGNIATQDVVSALINIGEHIPVDIEQLTRARRMLDPYLRSVSS
jgi:hydroxymethylglutaryl-CoA lyase